MYEDYYGFVHSPFTLAPDARFFYLSAPHQDALQQLLQSIRRRERFIVLTGDIGTGKTTLCRALLEHLDTTTFTALVLNPFLSAEELLRDVLLDFGVVSRDAVRSGRAASATKHELAAALRDFLQSLAPLGGSGVLIIDEAQHLSPQVLEELRILANLDAGASGLQIVLVGQPALLDVIADARMRQLDQRIALRATLRPLTREAVDAYVAHRLAIARGSSSVSFAPAALDRIHATSGGIPRVINLLCDRALMLGAEAGLSVITEDLVREAARRVAIAPAGVRRPWAVTAAWVALAVAALLLAAAALRFTGVWT
jgi:general secretion pathway protein A